MQKTAFFVSEIQPPGKFIFNKDQISIPRKISFEVFKVSLELPRKSLKHITFSKALLTQAIEWIFNFGNTFSTFMFWNEKTTVQLVSHILGHHFGNPDHTLMHLKNPPIENNIQFINLFCYFIHEAEAVCLAFLSVFGFSSCYQDSILVMQLTYISCSTFNFLQILAVTLLFFCFILFYLPILHQSNCPTIMHKTTTSTIASLLYNLQFGQHMSIHYQQSLMKAIQ